jgi:hypothetical protein
MGRQAISDSCLPRSLFAPGLNLHSLAKARQIISTAPGTDKHFFEVFESFEQDTIKAAKKPPQMLLKWPI